MSIVNRTADLALSGEGSPQPVSEEETPVTSAEEGDMYVERVKSWYYLHQAFGAHSFHNRSDNIQHVAREIKKVLERVPEVCKTGEEIRNFCSYWLTEDAKRTMELWYTAKGWSTTSVDDWVEKVALVFGSQSLEQRRTHALKKAAEMRPGSKRGGLDRHIQKFTSELLEADVALDRDALVIFAQTLDSTRTAAVGRLGNDFMDYLKRLRDLEEARGWGHSDTDDLSVARGPVGQADVFGSYL